ncbi:MAG: type II secretion system protein GspK [Planctomycetes bacterium]|nr:type II secretion system protein GspK [Planctomycetota bacterium]
MKPPLGSPKRGAVLLLVLGAVSVLAVLAVEVAHRSQVQTVEVARYAREAEFRRLFDSGIEAAKGLLAEKRADPRFDSWGDGWNALVSWEPGPGNRVSLQVEDESGKINLLRARDPASGAWTRGAIARLFEYLRKADPEREKEWRNTETRLWRRLNVTEQEEEAAIRPEVGGKQKVEDPPLTLDGLREAGIPMEVVFRAIDDEKPRPSLDCYLTTFGDGRVNLNTAPLAVLYALDPGLDEELAWQIAAWRGSGDGSAQAISANRAFLQARDMERVPGIVQRATVDGQEQVIRNLYADVQDQVGVKGQVFSVRMTAEVDGRKRQAVAYLESKAAGRGPDVVEVLAYEEIEP